METILDEATRLVHGDRGKNYGHPIIDFTCTAGILTYMFQRKGYLKEGVRFGPEDIPLIMEAVKLSRECNSHKRDNCVDGAGYWETLDMVHQAKDSFTTVQGGECPDGVVADLGLDIGKRE